MGQMTHDCRHLTTDELLELVADGTRRTVLRTLIDREDGRARVDELASIVAATAGPSVGNCPTSHETVRTRLHHRHLPRLAAAGIIEYEEERCTVRYYRNECLEALLEFIEEQG